MEHLDIASRYSMENLESNGASRYDEASTYSMEHLEFNEAFRSTNERLETQWSVWSWDETSNKRLKHQK